MHLEDALFVITEALGNCRLEISQEAQDKIDAIFCSKITGLHFGGPINTFVGSGGTIKIEVRKK